jgi:hypothetical protein
LRVQLRRQKFSKILGWGRELRAEMQIVSQNPNVTSQVAGDLVATSLTMASADAQEEHMTRNGHGANVLFMTVMASKMAFVGRG